MSCPKRAAAHIGRIGALAISLGVGTAVVAGAGTAWADTTDTAPNGPGSSSQQSRSAPTAAGPSRRAVRDAGSTAPKPRLAVQSAAQQSSTG